MTNTVLRKKVPLRKKIEAVYFPAPIITALTICEFPLYAFCIESFPFLFFFFFYHVLVLTTIVY